MLRVNQIGAFGIQRREKANDHYFVLVYLPPEFAEPRYFVLSSDELMRRREEYERRSKARGRYRDDLGGINWTTAFDYEDNWEVLPK